MRVLVTGACGFIGSHFVEKLIENKIDVLALAKYDSRNQRGWLDQIKSNRYLKKIDGDIRDADFVLNKTKKVDVIFNLAALIAIPFSYVSPKSYIDTNIIGTYNILNASLKNKIKKTFIISTSEVYGSAKYIPIDEKHPLNAQSPYAATKIAADQLSQSFQKTYDLPITILRPFNCFGPRQSARAIIPTLITQILSNKKILKVGNIKPRRDLTFVEDTTDALLLALKSKKNLTGEIFNIGSEYDISVEEILNILNTDFNFDFEIKIDKKRIRPIKSEVNRLLSSSKKFKKITGWKPIYSDKKKFKIALSKTIEWFKKEDNLKLYKPNEYNL